MSILEKYYRQPEIFIPLPNGAQFYPEGSIEITADNQLPVYAMNAKTDIALKTPDALLTGNAVVDCIQSCIPNIKNAWEMPSSEVDYCLIAIRIASYGNRMGMEAKCPSCSEQFEFDVDLGSYIEDLSQRKIEINQTIINYEIAGETIQLFVKPYTYKEFSLFQQQHFEKQKLIELTNNDQISDEEKMNIYNTILKDMSNLNFEMIRSCVSKIVTPDGEVTNQDQIVEFVDQAEIGLFNKIKKTIDDIRIKSELSPLEITCPACGHKYESPLIFDFSVFFA